MMNADLQVPAGGATEAGPGSPTKRGRQYHFRYENGAGGSSPPPLSSSTLTRSMVVRYGCVACLLLVLANGLYVSGQALRYNMSVGADGPEGDYHEGPPTMQQSSILSYRVPTGYSLPSWYYDDRPNNNKDRRPSREEPFIFFHQRKAGGTTVRDQLATAGNGTEVYIPCYRISNNGTKTPCETYTTPQALTSDPPTIYGGHLYYSSFLRTLQLSHEDPTNFGIPKYTPTVPNFTCFTVFRDPISRIHSCWNYRMVQDRVKRNADAVPKLSAIDANTTDVARLLTTSRSHFGEGCLNEPMRIFSDLGWNEDMVNDLYGLLIDDGDNNDDEEEGNNNHHRRREEQQEQRRIVAEHAVQQTIDRMSRCVIGILERPDDTKRNLQTHLPWLDGLVRFNVYNNTGVVDKGELSEATLDAIRRVSVYERFVYDVANQLLDAQLLRRRREHP